MPIRKLEKNLESNVIQRKFLA